MLDYLFHFENLVGSWFLIVILQIEQGYFSLCVLLSHLVYLDDNTKDQFDRNENYLLYEIGTNDTHKLFLIGLKWILFQNKMNLNCGMENIVLLGICHIIKELRQYFHINSVFLCLCFIQLQSIQPLGFITKLAIKNHN